MSTVVRAVVAAAALAFVVAGARAALASAPSGDVVAMCAHAPRGCHS
ncbi:hypothetical protein ACWDUH_24895 [Micromonospora wenchangensis]